MDNEWTERDKAFKKFYDNLTGEYHGKHFEATQGIAGYIDNKIVTPMMLRRMDEAHYDHLKEKGLSRMIPVGTPGILPSKLLANQQVCPVTMVMDSKDNMTITQMLHGSDVVRVIVDWKP